MIRATVVDDRPSGRAQDVLEWRGDDLDLGGHSRGEVRADFREDDMGRVDLDHLVGRRGQIRERRGGLDRSGDALSPGSPVRDPGRETAGDPLDG